MVQPQSFLIHRLGANVMLEYPVQEASELLNGKLDAARLSLKQVEEDLEYLREQVTTMEVNIARVYNYDVKNRREGKVAARESKE
jgi:prefoldin subunit 5